MTQAERAARFQALHERDGAFVLPNPWDAGTARLLASLGFEALATTSAGLAFMLGRPDGARAVTREEALANARLIVAGAGDLPVTVDLEDGYEATPEGVARTVRLAAEAGLVGCSVEDATYEAGRPIRDLGEAVERVAAAVGAARSLPFPFTLTARAENYLNGRPDLDDTIRRLQAFEAAGADVLYAPGLPDLAAVGAICSAVSRPVNVLVGGSSAGPRPTVVELAAAGARRISVGSALSRAALGAVLRAGREMLKWGSFSFADDAIPFAEANRLVARG
jgi:2-methylisocitrate lyase-like PEP mutase family enzyme